MNLSDPVIAYIISLVGPGQTILELGSGESTKTFIEEGRKVITVEHDPKWLGLAEGAEYIYAPIKEYDASYHLIKSMRKRTTHIGWYDYTVLREALRDKHYDLIFVDGPTGTIGRSGFLQHLSIFPNLSCPIVFDDQHRIDDLFVAECVARHLERDLRVMNNGLDKQPFSVIAKS